MERRARSRLRRSPLHRRRTQPARTANRVVHRASVAAGSPDDRAFNLDQPPGRERRCVRHSIECPRTPRADARPSRPRPSHLAQHRGRSAARAPRAPGHRDHPVSAHERQPLNRRDPDPQPVNEPGPDATANRSISGHARPFASSSAVSSPAGAPRAFAPGRRSSRRRCDRRRPGRRFRRASWCPVQTRA